MTAAPRLKRIAVGLAGVLIAVLAALALLPLLIPADHVRDAVQGEIRAITGLDVALRGNTAVTLFPSASVAFEGLVIGDHPSGEPALAAERLTARLRPLPLLIGRIEIADIALVRPRITVALDAHGRSNWSGLIKTLARTLKPDAPRADRIVSFSEIRMAAGTITIRNDSRGISETLTDVGLSVAWPSIAKGFGATGRFVWRDEPLDGSLSINDLFGALIGDRSGVKLRLNGAPLKLAFDGHFSHQPNLKLQGTIAADSASLRRTVRWAARRPLPDGGFGRFALTAQTNVVGNAITLSTVNVELDGNSAEGVLTLAIDGRPRLQGTLAADQLDLSPYISAFRLLGQNERDWSTGQIKLEGLSGFDLDLRLSAAQVALTGAKLGRTAAAANLRDGRMTITVGESQAFGGVLKGSLGLARAGTGVNVKTQVQFSDVDLETCLGELFAIRRLEGKGNLTLILEGSGTSVFEVARTLNGEAVLSARKGAVAGFNIEQLLRRLERRPLSIGGEFRSGRTPFEKFLVMLKIAQGTATIEDVRLEGSAIRLAVGGSASIPARDLDLKGMASLIPTATNDSRGAFELPFVVQGPWEDPILLPDADSLIRRSRAVAPLLDAIKDRKAR